MNLFLSSNESRNLKYMIETFKPLTLGEVMNMVSAKLTIDLDIKVLSIVNTLKYATFKFGIGHFSIHLIL